jgi:hypothetical protein
MQEEVPWELNSQHMVVIICNLIRIMKDWEVKLSRGEKRYKYDSSDILASAGSLRVYRNHVSKRPRLLLSPSAIT